MKHIAILTLLALSIALALSLAACGKNDEKKAPPAAETVVPDRGPVDLGGSATGQANKSADQAVVERVKKEREQAARDMGIDPKTGKRVGKYKSPEDNWAKGFKP